jgi:hypothetical protein
MVTDLQRRQALLQKICDLTQHERDPGFIATETQLLIKQDELNELRKRLPADATQLLACQRKVDALQKVVDAKFTRMPHVHGMDPIVLLPMKPATAPVGR